MLTLIRVCAWCDHEILGNDEPGKKYESDCTQATASHDCCKKCRPGVQAEIDEYLKEARNADPT